MFDARDASISPQIWSDKRINQDVGCVRQEDRADERDWLPDR